MTRRVTRTPQAIDDLAEIAAYIAKDNPAAAKRLGETLDAKTRSWRSNPASAGNTPANVRVCFAPESI